MLTWYSDNRRLATIVTLDADAHAHASKVYSISADSSAARLHQALLRYTMTAVWWRRGCEEWGDVWWWGSFDLSRNYQSHNSDFPCNWNVGVVGLFPILEGWVLVEFAVVLSIEKMMM